MPTCPFTGVWLRIGSGGQIIPASSASPNCKQCPVEFARAKCVPYCLLATFCPPPFPANVCTLPTRSCTLLEDCKVEQPSSLLISPAHRDPAEDALGISAEKLRRMLITVSLLLP
ncbi:hypothetical protein GOP47_0023418 [Adiantum capillus-veneris]|uniref:Uncharacterized protein n=1 Tax=Adiantum capillus-veneris TaxID=13818 RepID=A0A9D4U3M7_ADICA|nr:hypothetical protein GOP47_0023418 [Adiantum capillus-veneris]